MVGTFTLHRMDDSRTADTGPSPRRGQGMPVVEDEATTPPDPHDADAEKEHPADEDAKQRKWSTLVLGTLQDLATPANVAIVGGLALVLIVAAFGGWGFATSEVEETLPTAAPSEATTAEPFEFEILKAFTAEELPPIVPKEDGVRYVLVTAQVTNRDDLPVEALTLHDAITIDASGLAVQEVDGQEKVVPPRAYRVDDGLAQLTSQPDVTTKVVFVWKQDARREPPKKLTVTLKSHTYRRSALGTGMAWLSPEEKVTVSVPVQEVPQ